MVVPRRRLRRITYNLTCDSSAMELESEGLIQPASLATDGRSFGSTSIFSSGQGDESGIKRRRGPVIPTLHQMQNHEFAKLAADNWSPSDARETASHTFQPDLVETIYQKLKDVDFELNKGMVLCELMC